MEFEVKHIINLLKIYSGKDFGSILFVFAMFIGINLVNFGIKVLPKYIKDKYFTKIPETDLDNIFAEKVHWNSTMSHNLEGIWFITDENWFCSQILEAIENQRKNNCHTVTFNFMDINRLNDSFCDAFRKAVLESLAKNKIVVQIVFPPFAPERLEQLYINLKNIIEASKKSSVIIRKGERRKES